jgi:hypothetical protein
MAVDGEGVGEGFDGREEPLLEIGSNELELDLFLAGGLGEDFLGLGAVLVEEFGELKFGSSLGRDGDGFRDDFSFGKAAGDLADVFLEAVHYHGFEVLFGRRTPGRKRWGSRRLRKWASLRWRTCSLLKITTTGRVLGSCRWVVV